MDLVGRLEHVLRERGSATVPVLMRELRRQGPARLPRSMVERILTGDDRFVTDDDPTKPRWSLHDPEAAVVSSPTAGRSNTRAALDVLDLRPWQAQALAAWTATGRGVVEAVTGTGKTRLAMAAIRVLADRGARTLVLAPTLELQQQWARELRAAAPDLRVGRLGGGHRDDLHECDVVVSTPHSAATVPIEPPPGATGLLVADEAHRYGAPTWSAALREEFAFRLALTATYERNDEGVEDVLTPYFGAVVHRYGFERAVADGTVAPFRIALVGVGLSEREREEYERADNRTRQLHRELVGGLGMPKDPRKLFAAVSAVVAEADGREGGPQVRACREYLLRVRERREVAAGATGKLALCGALAPALTDRRTLAFADTVEQAEAAASELARGGVRAETLHGGLRDDKRRIRLAQFRKGNLDALVAPRVLDEGVDVPDADVALVLAAFRTRRQLIQRLGRVLRLKPDGRAATLVLVHAEDTHEDPANGGHADFLRMVRDVAIEVVAHDAHASLEGVRGWLTSPIADRLASAVRRGGQNAATGHDRPVRPSARSGGPVE